MTSREKRAYNCRKCNRLLKVCNAHPCPAKQLAKEKRQIKPKEVSPSYSLEDPAIIAIASGVSNLAVTSKSENSLILAQDVSSRDSSFLDREILAIHDLLNSKEEELAYFLLEARHLLVGKAHDAILTDVTVHGMQVDVFVELSNEFASTYGRYINSKIYQRLERETEKCVGNTEAVKKGVIVIFLKGSFFFFFTKEWGI